MADFGIGVGVAGTWVGVGVIVGIGLGVDVETGWTAAVKEGLGDGSRVGAGAQEARMKMSRRAGKRR